MNPETLARERSSRAGLISLRHNRWTHTLVGVYRSREAGIDTGEEKYAVVCEDHGTILGCETRVQALRAATHPEWCAVCLDSKSALWARKL